MSSSSNTGAHVIGIDVGGTKILGSVVDPSDWTVNTTIKRPTPVGDALLLSDAIGDVVDELMQTHGSPSAVGVGVPGLVDHDGIFHYGPNVQGVLGLDMTSDLHQRFGLDVMAFNDGTAAAVAEHRLGAAVGHDNAIIVAQGTGIAGGLVVGGSVVTGAHGFAGEPGHMLIAAAPNGSGDGHLCACGRVGCWEAVSSGAGLANIARGRAEKGRGTAIVELAGGVVADIRGEHVAEAMALGDNEAAAVFDEFATWVARGLASLVALLDPSIIVLGGGLTQINDFFIDKVRDRYDSYTVGAGHRPVILIVPAQLGVEAGSIGAALMAHERFS